MSNDKLSRFQRFDVEVVSRKELRDAPYNPRMIDDSARKRLKAGLQKHGLVQPVVWNKRTGNVVAGHQRLELLDTLEKSGDYDIQVAVIDVDDRDEKELNVQLNNPSMQGWWDTEKLAALHDESGIEFKDMGFSELDVDLLFDGNERYSEIFTDDEGVKEAKDSLRSIKESRKEATERLKDEQSAAYYFTVVCSSPEEKADALVRIGVKPYEDFVIWDKIASRLAPPKTG